MAENDENDEDALHWYLLTVQYGCSDGYFGIGQLFEKRGMWHEAVKQYESYNRGLALTELSFAPIGCRH